MRTDQSSPVAAARTRLRAWTGRARRWLAAQGPVARIALLVAALAALLGFGYVSTPERGPAGPGWVWILEGRSLSRAQLARVRDTLDVQGIAYTSDRSNRIGVKLDRKAEAIEALAKARVAPPTLDEIDEQTGESRGLFEGPDEVARRDQKLLIESIKAQIKDLDESIDSALVRINRVRAGGYRGGEVVSAFVNLRVVDNRQLGHEVIDRIQTILTGLVPDLKPDAITVIDRARTYMSAGNRELKEQVTTRAREGQWRDAILVALRYIRGVDVRVQLEIPPPAPAPVVAATPEPSDLASAETVRPNVPLAVEPDPLPEPAPAAPPAPPAPARPRANVWVSVPRSFYLMAYEAQSPHRKPRPEDLKAFEATTERTIQNAVHSVIQRDDLGRVDIDTVQDDLALAAPPAPAVIPDPQFAVPWPVVSGGIGLLVIVAGVMAVHLVRVARRPAPRPAAANRRADFASDAGQGIAPGPSERVRELIRLDPEAAAGALQRWIGHGEAAG